MIFKLMVNFKPGDTEETTFLLVTGGLEEKMRATCVIVKTAFLKVRI
mgnify:CR=1 FL=1